MVRGSVPWVARGRLNAGGLFSGDLDPFRETANWVGLPRTPSTINVHGCTLD